MTKKMTLRQQAVVEIGPASDRAHKIDGTMQEYGVQCWLAGHRANRLTKAERAVVDAAEYWHANTTLAAETRLVHALRALERAKGGAR